MQAGGGLGGSGELGKSLAHALDGLRAAPLQRALLLREAPQGAQPAVGVEGGPVLGGIVGELKRAEARDCPTVGALAEIPETRRAGPS